MVLGYYKNIKPQKEKLISKLKSDMKELECNVNEKEEEILNLKMTL